MGRWRDKELIVRHKERQRDETNRHRCGSILTKANKQQEMNKENSLFIYTYTHTHIHRFIRIFVFAHTLFFS